VVVWTGIIFTEVHVDEGVVERLVVDPQEEKLPGLKVGLELEGDDFERSHTRGEGLWFGCDHPGERAHLVVPIICTTFIDV
jgi:hypothetical protein